MSKQVSFDPSTFTWPCNVCHAERPDAKISVHKVDITPEELPPGTVILNIKFCNDNPLCEAAAKNWKAEKGSLKQ